jgi:hypothetical protein
MSQFNQQFITSIIDRYGLELDDERIDSTVATWLQQYDSAWIVKAIVESLHRGRYKIKSVDSILSGWQRVGKPSYNFTPEFEREILQDLPTIADLADTQTSPTLSQSDNLDPAVQSPALSSEQLNPEESAPFPHHDCYRRRQAVRATPVLQSPTLERGTTLQREQIVGVGGASAAPNGRFTPTAEADLQDHRPAIPKPPLVVILKEEEDVKSDRITPHTKFQLFQTLRAIVTPNNLQSTSFENLDPSTLYSGDLVDRSPSFGLLLRNVGRD